MSTGNLIQLFACSCKSQWFNSFVLGPDTKLFDRRERCVLDCTVVSDMFAVDGGGSRHLEHQLTLQQAQQRVGILLLDKLRHSVAQVHGG
jgi:hypothetical protein